MAVNVRCTCGYFMQLPDNWAGKQGRCPQCGQVLNIPATQPAARPQRVPSPEPDLAEQRDREREASPMPVAEPDSAPERVLPNPAWIAAMVSGVALVLVGFFLVMRGHGKTEPATDNRNALESGALPVVDDQQNAAPVFRPQLRSDPQAESDQSIGSGSVSVDVPKRQRTDAAPAIAAAPQTATCNLREFGVLVPSGAAIIEIDGVPLAVRNVGDLAGPGGVALVLPLGRHIVRFTRAEPVRVVEPKRWFIDAYREVANGAQQAGRWNFDRLLEYSRQSLDRFSEPLIPHFWGNYYWQEGEYSAAARHYRWALEIAPTFAPAYFNLAALAHSRKDDEMARRFLRRAELWNAQNAYGLAQAISVLHGELGDSSVSDDDDDPDWFVPSSEALSPRDRDMIAVLRSSAEFEPRISEQAKILNNLGAYFEHVGQPERALQSYRAAAAVLGTSRLSSDERRVIHGILDNLTRVCRQADMPEYRRYERLQAMIP